MVCDVNEHFMTYCGFILNLFTRGLAMVFMKILQHHFVIIIGYYSTSQKLVSRILLPCKCLHTNYDEMVLIFFINIIAKPHVKKLTVTFAMEHC